MRTPINIGTHHLHAEPNMNYQANRCYTGGGDLEEIKAATRRIRTLDDWKRTFLDLAGKTRAENRLVPAAAYYRAANFFMAPEDPDKQASYDTYVGLAHAIHQNLFTSGAIQEIKVPYEQGFLAAWHVRPLETPDSRNVVVMLLGFDAFKEEMLPIVDYFREAGLELILFEGPGQGETLWKFGIRMTHAYERPVKAVLDFFGLDDVTLIGISLGAYLAPRAAAYEPRVKRVIAWGVMYDFLATVLSRRGKLFELLGRTLLALKAKRLLNAVIAWKMQHDTYTRWGVEHGMHVMGAGSPYEYLEQLRRYTTRTMAHLITQDFLLMGSTHDHFVPRAHFARQALLLENVKSFTARIFTRQEQAENHVSFGNTPLVVREMIDWIKHRSAPETA